MSNPRRNASVPRSIVAANQAADEFMIALQIWNEELDNIEVHREIIDNVYEVASNVGFLLGKHAEIVSDRHLLFTSPHRQYRSQSPYTVQGAIKGTFHGFYLGSFEYPYIEGSRNGLGIITLAGCTIPSNASEQTPVKVLSPISAIESMAFGLDHETN